MKKSGRMKQNPQCVSKFGQIVRLMKRLLPELASRNRDKTSTERATKIVSLAIPARRLLLAAIVKSCDLQALVSSKKIETLVACQVCLEILKSRVFKARFSGWYCQLGNSSLRESFLECSPKFGVRTQLEFTQLETLRIFVLRKTTSSNFEAQSDTNHRP